MDLAAYARELFTDMALAWTSKHGEPPAGEEARTLAKRSLVMAKTFAAVPQTLGPSRVASGSAERKDASPGSLAEIVSQWARAATGSVGGPHRNILLRMERYVFPYIGSRSIHAIEAGELLAVIRQTQQSGPPGMYHQLHRDLRYLFRYLLVAGITKNDPTKHLRWLVKQPKHKSPPLFDDDALGQLMLAIRQYRGSACSGGPLCLRFAPLVFLRPSELVRLKWKYVDLDAALIFLPSDVMKWPRAHVVPLAKQAIRVLEQADSMTHGKQYVFCNGRGEDKPVSYALLHKVMTRLSSGTTITPHRFRFLASTWLHEQGYRSEAVERQLAHVPLDRLRRIYDRAEYLGERRKMMQAWADYLDRVEGRAKALFPGKEVRRRLAMGGRDAAI